MKFALVNGQRQEPQPNLLGECPGCGNPMVARCGEIRVWHWAHQGRRHCDIWWENETEWHRDWKGQFPARWQEFVQRAEDGERHIADVKTDDGWAIEFQHSFIKPEERRSREAFYQNLVWVVDGLRRKRDEAGFRRALDDIGANLNANSRVRKIWRHEGALLRDWAGSSAHVFFDFGDKYLNYSHNQVDFGDQQVLWWILPSTDDTWVWVAPLSRAMFIETLQRTKAQEAGGFGSVAEKLMGWVTDYESKRRKELSLGAQRHLPRMIKKPSLKRFRRRPRRL